MRPPRASALRYRADATQSDHRTHNLDLDTVAQNCPELLCEPQVSRVAVAAFNWTGHSQDTRSSWADESVTFEPTVWFRMAGKATSPATGMTAAAGSLHRVVLHCPGLDFCPRGGCEAALDDAVLAAVGLVAADVAVTAPIAAGADWAADAHRASLIGTEDDEPADVLSVVTAPLLAAGWEETSSSSSELGDIEVLLSRREHVLTAAYRPLTRTVELADGRPELDLLYQLLADEGQLVDSPDGVSWVDRAAATADWGDPLLTAIEKHLRGDLADDGPLAEPTKVLLAGVWPWGFGVPHGDDEWGLVHRQVMMNLARTTLLGT
jgi:hypothetical protein